MAAGSGITIKGAPASAEQKRILRRALQLADRWNAPHRAKVALVEALIVESEAKNLSSASADGYGSYGVLQGRDIYHKRSDLMDPDYQVGVFLGKGRGGKKTGGKGFTGRGNAIGLTKSGMKSGQIAQAIEGSAYPHRYQEVQQEAMRIVRSLSGVPSSGPVKAAQRGQTITLKGADTEQIDQAAYQKAKGQAVLGAFLKKRNPNNPLLKLGVVSPTEPNPADFVRTVKGKDTKVAVPGQPQAKAAVSEGGATAFTAAALSRAAAINNKKLPYKWGGGHGGKVNAYKAEPLDCSGAVSAVLGIDPRVSGQFKTWGRPGDGGDKGITVYSNDKHVLMKINGRFFGTSGSNPGGGAGWIPRGKVSTEYLKNFTARHSKR